jgi:hypothetical protein
MSATNTSQSSARTNLDFQVEVLYALGPTLEEAVQDTILNQLGYYLGEVSDGAELSDAELEDQVLEHIHADHLSPAALEILRDYIHRVVADTADAHL